MENLWIASLTMGALGLILGSIPIGFTIVRRWRSRKYEEFVNEFIAKLVSIDELREWQKNGDGQQIQKRITSEVKLLSMKYFGKEVPPLPKSAALKAIVSQKLQVKMNCFICKQQIEPSDQGGCPNCGLFCLMWAIYLPGLYDE